MAHLFADRVLEAATVDGTNDVTLAGAVAGYRAVSSVAADGDTLHYMVQGVDATGRPNGDWEVGRGTYSSGSVSRTSVISSSTGSKVSFAAGLKQIALTVAAPSTATLAGDWRSAIGALARGGDDLTGALNYAPTVSFASASNLSLQTRLSNVLEVTGSTTITALGTLAAGAIRSLRFTGSPQITHNATSLILPNGANIAVQAGDTAEFESLGSGNWRLRNYMRASGAGAYLTMAPTAAAAMQALGLSDQPTFRNLLINGDARMNQEGLTALTGNGAFPVDMWQIGNGPGTGRITAQQVTSANFPGFITALQATVTTSGSPAAGDMHVFVQGMEGYFTSFLGYGASGAIGTYFSGFFRSSVAGTFALSLRNAAQNRSYVTPLVINQANTTEYKSFFIPGDTSGTWGIASGVGIYLAIGLAVGTTYQTGTAGSWQAGHFTGLTGQTQLTSTNGATFQMTGLQFEPLFLTPFERLPLDVSHRRCRRYWQSSYPLGAVIGSADIANAWRGYAINANDLIVNAPLPEEMRAPPSTALYNPSTGAVSTIRRIATGGSVTLTAGMTTGARSMYSCAAAGGLITGEMYDFHWIANARI